MVETAIQRQNQSHYFRATTNNNRVYKLKHRSEASGESPCYVPAYHPSDAELGDQGQYTSTLEPTQTALSYSERRYLNSLSDPEKGHDEIDSLITEALSDHLAVDGCGSREQRPVFNPWSRDAYLVDDYAGASDQDPPLAKEIVADGLSSPKDANLEHLFQISPGDDPYGLNSPSSVLEQPFFDSLDLEAIARGFDATFTYMSPESYDGLGIRGDNPTDLKLEHTKTPPQDWQLGAPSSPQYSQHSSSMANAHYKWTNKPEPKTPHYSEPYTPDSAKFRPAEVPRTNNYREFGRSYWQGGLPPSGLPKVSSAVNPISKYPSISSSRALQTFRHRQRAFQKRVGMVQHPDLQAFGKSHSLSKLPLLDLYACMGLSHDPDEAKRREQEVMSLLEEQGFVIGQQTWIRDTPEPERNRILQHIQSITKEKWGYSLLTLEAIIRRGTYSRMQTLLRKHRREREAETEKRG